MAKRFRRHGPGVLLVLVLTVGVCVLSLVNQGASAEKAGAELPLAAMAGP